MDESKKNSDEAKPADGAGSSIDTTSPDALNASAPVQNAPGAAEEAPKKKGFGLPGPLQKYGHRFNIYLLFFMLIIVVAGAILVVTALASKKVKDPSTINSQNLSADAL